MRRAARHTHDGLALRANVRIEVRDAQTDALLEWRAVHNLVVDAGIGQILDRIFNDTTTGPKFITHFAVGTSNAAVTSGQTALTAETFRDALTQVTRLNAVLTVRQFLSSTQANGVTLQEAGIFNASSGGTMLARAVYTGIAKDATRTVTFIWTFTLTAS